MFTFYLQKSTVANKKSAFRRIKGSTGVLNCPILLLVGVGWGKSPHPIIVVYLVTSVDLIKPSFAAKKRMDLSAEKRMARENHPFALFCSHSAFPLVIRRLKARVHKELHYILGRIGQKHRYPMEFVHVIGGIMICFSLF